jgi:hypothetical protein
MSNHSFLYSILVSLTSSVNYITTHAPVPNGFLKRKLYFSFKFIDFEEFRQENMCIPDGLILNEQKKFLIIPECKSAIPPENDEEEPRIQHQVSCFCSNEFHEILHKIIDYTDYEIVIFTFSEIVGSMIKQVEALRTKTNANIVIWSVEEDHFKKEVKILKVYGNHTNQELNNVMSIGALCEPPAREFIDPDMPEPRIAYVLGGRLLCTLADRLLQGNMQVNIPEFRNGNLDLVVSENRLKHYLRVLAKLSPGLCTFDSKTQNIILKKRINWIKVSQRLSEINQMTNAQYRKALGYPIEDEPYRKIEKEIEETIKPKRTPTLDELWGSKK